MDSGTNLAQHEISAKIELVEAEFMYHYESMAPESTKATLGIATRRIGGGVALSMRHDVTGYWSKALGFGFTEPVTAQLINRLIEFYRAEQSGGAVLQLAPSVLPPDWSEICQRHGLRPDSEWIKLACPIEEFDGESSTDLRVGPVGPEHFQEYAVTTMQAFGMPEHGLVDMMAASLSHPHFYPFAAWDGNEIVATANLFVHEGTGSLNAAGTLPSYRNCGAQSALIAARARGAVDLGCRWLCAEVGKPAEGEVNPSLNNLLRAGLQPTYERQNWNWSPSA